MRPPLLARNALAIAVAAVLIRAHSASALPAAAPSRADLRVEPRTIDVGMFYRGTTVRVEGTAPAGFRIALVCVGKSGKVQLKRKGKVWNVLWMNVGRVAFDRVPALYHASADDLGESRPDRLVIPADLRLGLGYDGVEAQVLSEQADETTRRLFREFIKLKIAEGLYSFGKLSRESASVAGPDLQVDGARDSFGKLNSENGSGPTPPARISAEFSLPANIPPGEYDIRMIGYRNGAGELLASEKLVAERVGLARFISTMSERHGVLYGIISVVLAIAAGFLTGMIFASAKKGH